MTVQQDQVPTPRVPAALRGGAISAVFALCFHNVQVISDMLVGPQPDGGMSGFVAAPIIFGTVIWLILTVRKFTGWFVHNATTGRGFSWPPPFWLGAFVVSAIYFLLAQLVAS